MKAVIFDLEGTLIDLSSGHVKAYNEVLSGRYGLEFTHDDFLIGYGRHPWRIIKDFLEKKGVHDGNYREVAEQKQVILREKYRKELKVLPGVRKLLEDLLEAGAQIALATSTPRKNMEFMLKDPDLWDYFKVKVVAEDVKEAKPHPQIYQLAAEKLKVKPEDCWVIEDSLPGVQAGKAAGMRVIGVQTGFRTREELEKAGADLVVEDLEELTLEDLDTKAVNNRPIV